MSETEKPDLSRHPFHQEWLEREGYLKDNLSTACAEIAKLKVENQKLRSEIDGLPRGAQNLLRKGPWENTKS